MDDSFLTNCLFFTSNRLSRIITKIAEEEFASTGLTPMYGYLVRLVVSAPGISQKELSEKLSITPSTLTRFVDKLEGKQLVERKVNGKTVLVYPTPKGEALVGTIREASRRFRERYEAILGTETVRKMTEEHESISSLLEKKP
ncbi:MarR family winged helix-turn-helix transcriptional regulator [Paenibacillus humicola]|uniref:MarR family winged helix-turn-helix transcriptional regulator n=1 Tax=Paenibacillus humicola TaxID=3110540 RepID=UPI00237BB9E7|nr:MarR family transcriptional regulator [Paenibacillus humicola]